LPYRAGSLLRGLSCSRASGGYQVTTTTYSPAGAPSPYGGVRREKVPSGPAVADGTTDSGPLLSG
jgi:hypothetical protein